MAPVWGLAMTMLWISALGLIVLNGDAATKVLKGVGDSWTAALRTLQGR